jgi:hypothetical protein
VADDAELINWVVEVIPDAHRLYMRVHKMFVYQGDFVVGVFRDQGEGMSTEWEKYSSPEDARSRARVPSENGIIEMVSGSVSEIPGLRVQHAPDLELRIRGHTEVIGDKKTDPEVRVKLKRISRWVIALPQ